MLGALGNPQLRPVELVVVLPVVEVRVDAVADLEVVVRGDGHVAGIEQLVDIGSQQQPVLDVVPRRFTERPDVSCLERRERLLARYRALLRPYTSVTTVRKIPCPTRGLTVAGSP